MKDLIFRDFEEGDFDNIIEIKNEQGLEFHKDFIEWGKIRKDNGAAYTILTPDGSIICCFGVQVLWAGVGEVWATFTDLLKQYKKEAVIHTGWLLDNMQESLELWRIQADVIADAEESNRYIKHYGFIAEGTMQKYNPWGLDVIRYSRIRGA